MRLRRAARVILVGAPGVGKGTQSERLLERFPQLVHISSGDLLRHNIKSRTALGIKVESTIKSGGLVSDDLILRLIRNELATRGWLVNDGPPPVMTLASSGLASSLGTGGGSGAAGAATGASPIAAAAAAAASAAAAAATSAFVSAEAAAAPAPSHLLDNPAVSCLLDGFPRTAAQAEQLESLVPVNLVVSLKTPFDVLLQRITGRWVHESSGRVYNDTFHAPRVPGRDDVTGEPLVRRADDTESVYRARFDKFVETSAPLLAHYAARDVLWEVEGNSSDEISPKLFAEFERRFCT